MAGLVNNAGITSRCPVEACILDDARDLFEINLFGTIALTQKFLPLLRKDQGRIVFISSVLGILSVYGSSIYSASKRAMEGLVDALRIEVQPFGVSVSSVQPGYIQSLISDKVTIPVDKIPPEVFKTYQKYFDNVIEGRKNSKGIAGPPSLTSDVIRHALVDPYPRTRYAIGPVSKLLSAQVACFLSDILPDRLVDILI